MSDDNDIVTTATEMNMKMKMKRLSLIDIGIEDLKAVDNKWGDAVPGVDGNIYGIPFYASHVVQCNINMNTDMDISITDRSIDNVESSTTSMSMKEIGPDFGYGPWNKWGKGVLTPSGIIYCIPYCSDSVLKIDTNIGQTNGNVTIMNAILPEKGEYKWLSGAISKIDGCIYCMPNTARRILKIDPVNDTVESVGEDLGGQAHKYWGTVADENGIIYGIPCNSTRIIKIDPTPTIQCDADAGTISTSTSIVGKEADKKIRCRDGVLAHDGNIYSANDKGDILRIDVKQNAYAIIENTLEESSSSSLDNNNKDRDRDRLEGWGDPVIGQDKCIYMPPLNANHVMKFNTITQRQSLVKVLGDENMVGDNKWITGALVSNGSIYCIPRDADHVLAIDTRPGRQFEGFSDEGTCM